MPGKIRFGMVGTGFIADWVLAGARQDARFEAVAICSRTQERADAFAAKHGIPHTFTLLEEMAASPLVDAVYIATPNFLHASQSILCMRHGKHVLCEKPLASNAREARQMVAVARECGEVLGPEGVGYVQVSPPQESIQGTQWWTSYQPVSYKLDSKEGTEAEFKNMVRQCKAAGVGVIADTVINHTTGVDKTQGTGTAGSPYDNKGYFPEAGYTPSDFHAPCSIWTYRDAESVWNCQVSGLQDLDTSSPHVRDVLSDYFVKLLDYGVAGFRVDAVKHMPPEDVLAIKKLVAKKSGRSMNDIWWTQEVIGDNAEAAEIQPRNYLKTGQVNEFQYAYRLKSLFSNSLAGGSLSIKDIPQNITDSGKASVFVTNWDTERNNMTLTYKDGDAYRLANAFMLAYPYGAPNVFSGYEFHDTDSGASGATATSVPDIDCSKDSGWSCTERWPDVHGMVGWHNVAGDAPLSDWQDDGDNMIAFGRGGRAFIAINNSVRTRTVTYHTALPAGEYCDVYASADCSGSVHVRFDGDATLTVPAGSAVAFHIAATPYTVRQ